MNRDKVKYLKDKKTEKIADINFEAINKTMQNPIKAKFLAFQKTKKDIGSKDLF